MATKSPPKSDLPPKRKGKGIRTDVQAPLGTIRIKNFIYILAGVTLLISLLYAYRLTMIQVNRVAAMWGYEEKPKEPVPTILNESAEESQLQRYRKPSIEQQIANLAEEFGITPAELASAIGSAIQSKIPVESVTSIIHSSEESGKVMDALKEGFGEPVKQGAGGAAAAFVETVASMGQMAGFDDQMLFDE